MNKFLLLFGIAGVIVIRHLEDDIFYDPVAIYFENGKDWDEVMQTIQYFRFYCFTGLRYALNTLFSTLIIHSLFGLERVREFLIWAITSFIPLIMVYHLCISYSNPESLFLFYIRRLIIQPLLGIVGIFAFYYFYGFSWYERKK